MITAGDVQFEPPATKVTFLTSSIAVMASGDLSFHSEILIEVNRAVRQMISNDPHTWLRVKDVVDIYIKERNRAKLSRAEADILAPLNLNRDSFLTAQANMDTQLVDKIAQELINYNVPDVSVIILGVDSLDGNIGPHIYTVHNTYVSCDDRIGFSAIGSGSRHAESQFMLARHAWDRELPKTLLLTYTAKKDSEVAPGVGGDTDMFMIGPGLGQSTPIKDEVLGKLEEEYQKLNETRQRAQIEAQEEMKRYVVGLGQEAASDQAARPTQGGETPVDRSAAGGSA